MQDMEMIPATLAWSMIIAGDGKLIAILWYYSKTTGSNTTGPESIASTIGLINLQEKLAGKPGTG
jgi:hypothetical protein